jgi:hypothetical protein
MRTFVTTTDNPFNPLTDFDRWYAFDTQKGYNTCSYLARITPNTDELSEEDEEDVIENAVDDIVKLNLIGIYKKVTEDTA